MLDRNLLQSLNNEPYQPLGNLRLDFPDGDAYSDYRTTLDLDSAMLRTRYKVGRKTHEREMFVSYPDQVFVIRSSTDEPGGLSFSASLDSQLRSTVTSEGGDVLKVVGRAPYFNDVMSQETLYDDAGHDRGEPATPMIPIDPAGQSVGRW